MVLVYSGASGSVAGGSVIPAPGRTWNWKVKFWEKFTVVMVKLHQKSEFNLVQYYWLGNLNIMVKVNLGVCFGNKNPVF